MEPAAVQPVRLPVSKSPLVTALPPPPVVDSVQLKLVLPAAPVPSVAVTVTLEVPVALGVPEIRPVEELIDRPAGRPVAE